MDSDHSKEDTRQTLSENFWQLAIEQGANSASFVLSDRAHFAAAGQDLLGLEIAPSEENSIISSVTHRTEGAKRCNGVKLTDPQP
jgi:hypothetical protein